MALLLILPFCQLNTYAIDPGEVPPLSIDVSGQTARPSSFDQVVLKQFNDKFSGFSFRDAILDLMFLRKSFSEYPPKHFPIAVIRDTSISLSDGISSNRDSTEMIKLNNSGVRYLNANDYPAAIRCFNAALELDSQYRLAHDNLAIAYNNYALSLRQTPKKALTQFYLAQYINPSNETTQQNLDGIIRKLGLNPLSFDDRVALADQASADGNFLGALVEYRAAFKLKQTPIIASKIFNALSRLTNLERCINPYYIDKSDFPSEYKSTWNVNSRDLNADPRFETYMVNLQNSIEKRWFSPDVSKSYKVDVLFGVNKRGELIKIKIDESSGILPADKAAIRAVEDASPFPIPPLLQHPANFRLTFNYKYLNGPLDFREYPVDFGTYMQTLSGKIRASWRKPATKNSTKTILLFRIDRKGNLSDLRLSRTSGSHEIDLSAESAVRSAAPFPPLPPGAEPKVDIEFTFDLVESNSPVSTQTVFTGPPQTSSKTPYPFHEVAAYTSLLSERLERIWHAQLRPVTVIFRIGDHGDVSDLQIYSSSGDLTIDSKALAIVRNSAPFPKPPEGALPLDVQYTFK